MRLGFPDRLLHGVGPGVVDGFVGDAIGRHLFIVVDGLHVEAVGLRCHRRGDGNFPAALCLGRRYEQRRLRREGDEGT